MLSQSFTQFGGTSDVTNVTNVIVLVPCNKYNLFQELICLAACEIFLESMCIYEHTQTYTFLIRFAIGSV